MRISERAVLIWLVVLYVCIALYLALPFVPWAELKKDDKLAAWIQALGSILAVGAAFAVTFVQTTLTRRDIDRREHKDRRDRLLSTLEVVNQLGRYLGLLQIAADVARYGEGPMRNDLLARFVSERKFQQDFMLLYEEYQKGPIPEFGNAAYFLRFLGVFLKQVPGVVLELRDALNAKRSLEAPGVSLDTLNAQFYGIADSLNKIAEAPVVIQFERPPRTPT